MDYKFQFREKQVRTLPLTKICRSSNSSFSNKSGGFALIEVIISIVILSLVLVSAVGLLYSVGSAVEKNRDRLTATYLAQECLELVRNARDTAWINHHQWNCAWESGCEEKDILSDNGIKKTKTGIDDSKFSRNFETEDVSETDEFEVSLNNEAEITCNIYWGGEEEPSLSISQILTNWRKR